MDEQLLQDTANWAKAVVEFYGVQSELGIAATNAMSVCAEVRRLHQQGQTLRDDNEALISREQLHRELAEDAQRRVELIAQERDAALAERDALNVQLELAEMKLSVRKLVAEDRDAAYAALAEARRVLRECRSVMAEGLSDYWRAETRDLRAEIAAVLAQEEPS